MLNDEVKKYVDKNNISIVDFMKLAGVSRSTYYNYVNGLNQPTLKIALRMGRILKKPVEELFEIR